MTNDNRDKFVQIAERYGQLLKFYNVEELCAERMEQIKEFFPDIFDDRHSIAMFYRLFIPQLLLPQKIEKVIYLDADIIVKLNIMEFWKIELSNKPLGAIPEVYNFKDRDDGIRTKSKSITICGEGIVNVEDYFNSGVLLMNLKVLHKEEDTILAGMKFISEHLQFTFLDQDLLNYCFSTSYLKLPVKFNRFVMYARRENEWTIGENIYHYAAGRICFVMDSRDAFNQLFMNYFIKTPWVDADTRIALSGGIPSRKNYPVSVIIPLYNMEEYIGECLDSLLIQTFQAFEVIVVDDCSTDDSLKVVESYKDKFNGRLKLAKTEVNSGGGGYVPRNLGLKLAQGEYVYILDADDMILANALETFYSAAILYDAEVIYSKSRYSFNAPNDISLQKDSHSRKFPNLNTEFIIDNPEKNLSNFLSESNGGEFHTISSIFCQRNFLLSNRLFFPQIARSGDILWCVNIRSYVKRLLRISTPLYIYRRYNTNSITRTDREPSEQCLFWLAGLVEFADSLYELNRGNEFLAKNPSYALTILTNNLLWSLDRTEYARKELDSEELFKVLYSEFAKNFSGSVALLLSVFLSFINGEIKINEYYSEIFNKFNRYFTARIDIKFMSTEGDFQILSVSDDKAKVRKATWLPENEIGYLIPSYTGKVEFVAKATRDGQIRLELRGMDVRNPADRTKRIPYWIDYTKLVVNDEVIFDKLTPTWHDKPFRYNLEAKADEEIKIQVEWLPHRDNTGNVSAKVKELQEKSSKKDALISELKVALDNEKKIHGDNVKLIRKFSDYFTARVDIKLVSNDEGDFKILSVSDDKAKVRKAEWLPENEIGYFIHSYVGKMEIVAKVTGGGQFNLDLRGIDIRDPADKFKLIPYWIDYTKLTVNGEVIFDELTSVWHNKPYNYVLNVNDGEEIVIQAEWQPHRDKKSEEQTALISKLKVALDTEKKIHGDDVKLIRKFSDYFTARVDVKLVSNGVGDFQILSVSDDKAKVRKADWLSTNEIGYFVRSYVGKMELVAKVIGGGQLNLDLRGIDIRDPADKSKHIPYWIDYTKLIVNEEVLFEELTPVWHNKPYSYALNVNDGEEVKLQVEWLPHRDNTDNVLAKVKELQEKSSKKDALISELQAALDTEKKIHSDDVELIRKFSDYFTARVDVKLVSNGEGDFQILSVSDDKAKVKKAHWLTENEIGYFVHSWVGKMELVAKVIGGGQFNLDLRGRDVRKPGDRSKRIPFWIDYTKLIVNGEVIFDKLTLVWHNKPYRYSLDAKDSEEITISVEWLPHRSNT